MGNAYDLAATEAKPKIGGVYRDGYVPLGIKVMGPSVTEMGFVLMGEWRNLQYGIAQPRLKRWVRFLFLRRAVYWGSNSGLTRSQVREAINLAFRMDEYRIAQRASDLGLW